MWTLGREWIRSLRKHEIKFRTKGFVQKSTNSLPTKISSFTANATTSCLECKASSIFIKQWCLIVCSHFIGCVRIQASSSDMLLAWQVPEIRNSSSLIKSSIPGWSKSRCSRKQTKPCLSKPYLTASLLWKCKRFLRWDSFFGRLSWVGLSVFRGSVG